MSQYYSKLPKVKNYSRLIDPLWTLAASLAIVSLTRISFWTYPDDYFSYSDLLGYGVQVSALAMIIRLGIPFLVGIIIGLADEVTKKEAIAGGILASLLLVWPPILIPEEALSFSLYGKRYLLYVVYLVFGAAMTLMCQAGTLMIKKINQDRRGKAIVRGELLNWRDTIKPIILGVISSIIYAYIAAALGH